MTGTTESTQPAARPAVASRVAPPHDAPAEPTPAAPADGPPTQLLLLAGGRDLGVNVQRDWLLDERTRRIGRYGVLQIRETLRQHRPAEPPDSAVA